MFLRPAGFIRAVLTTALACAAAAPIATLSAQGRTGAQGRRLVQVALSGGLTLPSGDLKDFHDTGFHYDGALIFNLPGLPIAIRPELSLTTLKFKDGVIPASVPNSGDSRTQLLSGIGNIEVPLASGLYVLGGLGVMHLKTEVGSTASDDSAETKLVLDAGAGYRFRLSRIEGFVEARIGSASYERGKVGYSKAQFIPLTFGIVF